MSAFDADRLLSMSTFEAAFVLRHFRRLNPTYRNAQLVETIRSVRSDFFPNDYEAGLALERIVPIELDGTADVAYFRAAIESLVEHHKPLWMRLAPGGREHVLRAVSINGAQCFRNAGLLDTPPSKETSDWWDALASRIRSERDAQLLEQAREAERLSLDFERKRLRSLGIDKDPRLVSIEDNSAGYDILSYDIGVVDPTNRLIEVKSSSQEPPTIVVTRGEWQAALDYGASYVFHIWRFPAKTLIERTVGDIGEHIPLDKGSGSWMKVEIVLPSAHLTKKAGDS